MKKGLLVSFEGMDKSGKTTQIARARDCLEALGHSVLCVREPGGTAISEAIRPIILDRENRAMCAETEMLLYAASRAQLVREVILPALAAGQVVLCDRYLDSSLAYQGGGRGLAMADILAVNHIGTGGLIPDRTFFLETETRTRLARMSRHHSADRIENEAEAFQDRVRNAYKALADREPERIIRVSGEGSEEAVFGRIRPYLLEILRKE